VAMASATALALRLSFERIWRNHDLIPATLTAENQLSNPDPSVIPGLHPGFKVATVWAE